MYLLANGIRCYDCKDCSDNGVETDCDTAAPQIYKNATKCAKIEIRGKVSRECRLPGDLDKDGCTEVGVASLCLCSTDLCNKSATLDKTPIFIPISVFFVTKYLLKAF